MRKAPLITTLTLVGALLSGICRDAGADVKTKLLPPNPINTEITAGTFPQTGLSIPLGVERKLEYVPSYISIGSVLPLFSIDVLKNSDEIFSLCPAIDWQMRSSRDRTQTDYELGFKQFIMAKTRDGHDFWISGGITGHGSTPSKELSKKVLSSFTEFNFSRLEETGENLSGIAELLTKGMQSYSVPLNAYILPDTQSKHSLVFSAGIDDLLRKNPEIPNIHLSGAWKLPPMFTFEPFGEASPYLSVYTSFPTSPYGSSRIIGKAGLEIQGREGRINPYVQMDYAGHGEVYPNEEGISPFTFTSGISLYRNN